MEKRHIPTDRLRDDCWRKGDAVAAQENFLWGQNAILRGQKTKNLLKMADFGHFFLLTGGQVGEQSLQLGSKFSHAPLDAATGEMREGRGTNETTRVS